MRGLELTPHEATHGSPAIGVDADEHAPLPRSGSVMREGPGLQIISYATPSFGRIHLPETRGKRLRSSRLLERERLGSLEEGFDRSPQLGPELDLSGDRSLGDVCHQSGVKEELIGDLDRLSHDLKVA
jgi:hypothetical protein